MNRFSLFFRNFLACTFHRKLAYVLHFALPIVSFLAMFLLLRVGESAAFAGTQAIGLVIYFTMVQAVIVVSQILRDREQGIQRRINVSPASPAVYVAGNGAAALLVLSGQVLAFVGFVSFIFPVDSGLGFWPLLAILLIFNITAVGFGFLICAVADSSSGAIMAANVVVLFSSLMGGAFFPVEFMGYNLRRLAIAFPQYWVMKAIHQVQAGLPPAECGLSLLILLLFGLLFLVAQGVIRRRSTSLA
ncbi:MAG: hypothetical protein A2087_01980 [Spirochaetes bacterium GWD1_61_31]|nr:MAG: hypothetical protein A2Y37_11710 [Spirochaetes bacterium GWB1_60_80]OHD29933.1 MAG: hypothetical protein A2004_11950 [Spirochaetes bacterium GWC1_61_12]OHD43790.1 MAG: hypothetical protein A2087_01980 [Spirochaetes bacterium GWD1_61_31]OHD46032.1 MAG: hypothetical protein A2Y35_13535 [Spirochaetes bacterium GWE1_60_18]OHD60604.1 MAG: hypothetical protein A2Y32_08025 [Spirochaetes bacterium GWF1_60_12]HAP43443.1 hypothetical protein [Spirochaetaceae bacterium]